MYSGGAIDLSRVYNIDSSSHREMSFGFKFYSFKIRMYGSVENMEVECSMNLSNEAEAERNIKNIDKIDRLYSLILAAWIQYKGAQ